MSIKTNKSILSRIKITGTGKLLRRQTNQSHFNTKDTGNQGRAKHPTVGIKKVDLKAFKKYLPNNH
jgi:ribosomal protein L35